MTHIVKNLWVDNKPVTMRSAILSRDEAQRASLSGTAWHVTMTSVTEQPFNGGDLVTLKVELSDDRVLAGEAQCAFPYIVAEEEAPFSVRRDVFRGRSPLSEAGKPRRRTTASRR